MPLYDYICATCGNIFEIKKNINDPHPKDCPSCHGSPISRYHGPDISQLVQYKGKGWMKTDGKY